MGDIILVMVMCQIKGLCHDLDLNKTDNVRMGAECLKPSLSHASPLTPLLTLCLT